MFGGTSVLNHIKNGKLKGLAVSGSKSWSSMPELPTIGEFYPGYKSALWHGIYRAARARRSPSSTSCARNSTPCWRCRT